MTRPRDISAWLRRAAAASVVGYAGAAGAVEADAAPSGAGLSPPPGSDLAQAGYAALEAGDLKAAADRFVQAIERGGLAPEQSRQVALSLSDALLSLGHPREAEQALRLAGDPESFEVLARRAFALDASQDRRAAAAAYAAAARTAPSPVQRAAMWKGAAFAAASVGDRAAAAPAFAALAGDPNLSRTDALNLAYAALKFGDDRRAQGFFAAADRLQPLDGAAALDAGYSAKRMGDETAAVRFFRQGLASAVLGDRPEARDLVRREVADLSRRWGVVASVFYDGADAPMSRLPGAGEGAVQIGGEVYFRPLGWNGGRPVEAFVRAFQTLDSGRGDAVGGDSLQGWVGVRGKPIATQNVVLEASRLVKLGSASRNDWMVRASYSSSRGLDSRGPARDAMFHVFADAAQLLQSEETLAFVDGRLGRSFRYDGGRLIVAPFVGAVGGFDSALMRETALSAGPGLWVRRWFREDAFRATQSYVDLSLQYRARLSGDRRSAGFFASFSVSY